MLMQIPRKALKERMPVGLLSDLTFSFFYILSQLPLFQLLSSDCDPDLIYV